MTAHFTDISVSARYAELPGLLACVAARAAGLGLPAETSLRLQLVIEELFTNTITHGHRGESEHQISVAVGVFNDILTLRYEDDAPPFDQSAAELDTPSNVEIGGLGLGLIHGMSTAVRYRRQGPRNITEIDF